MKNITCRMPNWQTRYFANIGFFVNPILGNAPLGPSGAGLALVRAFFLQLWEVEKLFVFPLFETQTIEVSTILHAIIS